MKGLTWKALAGFGAAGLLVTTAVAGDEHKGKGSSASGTSSAPGGGATGGTGSEGTATGDSTGGTASGGAASGGSGSGARGSGQAGDSTGARPGEVTGAPPAPGGTSEKERHAAASAEDEVTGKVEKYDRQNRTLTLSDSDKKLKVTDDTQVMKDGNRVSPGQIMEGDEVRASFSGSGDEVEVKQIEITAGSQSSGTGSTAPGSSMGTGAQGGSPKGTSAGSSSETGSGSTGGAK